MQAFSEVCLAMQGFWFDMCCCECSAVPVCCDPLSLVIFEHIRCWAAERLLDAAADVATSRRLCNDCPTFSLRRCASCSHLGVGESLRMLSCVMMKVFIVFHVPTACHRAMGYLVARARMCVCVQ